MSFSLRKYVGEFVFPSFCCSCHALGPYLCQYCYEKIEFYFIPISLESLPIEEKFLDELIAAVRYEPVIGSVLHQMKYKHGQDIAEFCADFLYCTTFFPKSDFISAVPIHKSRKQERGFNQSELISRRLSELTQVPYINFLEKKKKTATQASQKNQAERLHNLDHAFSFHSQKNEVTGKTVLLIDDVCTTGSTLNACAKVLKKHGVQRVIGLTIAHGY